MMNHVADFVRLYEGADSTAERYAVRLRQWRDWLADRGKDIDNVADDVDSRTAEGVTTNDVKLFLSHLEEEGYAESTRTVARSAISQFYQHLQTPNPAENAADSWSSTTRKKREMRDKYGFEQLKTGDVKAMIEAVPDPEFRNRVLVRLLAQTGIRRGEAAQLRVSDVSIENRTLNVYGEKDDEYRTVPFSDTLRTPLQIWTNTKREHIYGVDESTEWLFPSRDGGHISGYSINEIVKTAAEKADLQKSYGEDSEGRKQNLITAHSLRHYYALQCAKNEMKAPFLRKLMGHTDISITQVYLNAASDTVVEKGKIHGPDV
jgi:integrase/recombinase XerD